MGETIDRKVAAELIETTDAMDSAGLTGPMIADSITFAYKTIDHIDDALSSVGAERLVDIVELASFSAILGNLIKLGIIRASKGKFKQNHPHTYPDLLTTSPSVGGVEIKIAFEKNQPKGHLAKVGNYLTFRYVLGDNEGRYRRGKENRGSVPWIWEVRFGYLDTADFSISSTEGDSGKTAVINKLGREKMEVVFTNARFRPYVRGAPA